MGMIYRQSRFNEAVSWAEKYIPFQDATVLTDTPWGLTVRLSGDVKNHYLKVLPETSSASIASSKAAAQLAANNAPAVVASDPRRCFMILKDHEGKADPSCNTIDLKYRVLEQYAQIQAQDQVLGNDTALKNLPQFDALATWQNVCAFASAKGAVNGMKLSNIIGSKHANYLHQALSLSQNQFENLIAPLEDLKSTINHGDLHLDNVAMLDDGSIVFHDWDNAQAGPAGLSLSSLLASASSTLRYLLTVDENAASTAQDIDVSLVNHYASTLVSRGYIESEMINSALAASLFCGLLMRLDAYSQYDISGEDERALCAPDVTNICDTLINCCLVLHQIDPQNSVEMARFVRDQLSWATFFDHIWEMSIAAPAVIADMQASDAPLQEGFQESLTHTTALIQEIHEAGQEGIVPSVSFTGADYADSELFELKGNVAASLFFQYGCLAIRNAVAPNLLERCYQELDLEHPAGAGQAYEVGNARQMTSLPVHGAFNNPNIYASSAIFHVLSRALGSNFNVGSFTTVTSYPGAQEQHLHIDHSNLYSELQDMPRLPAHAVTVLAPLVDVDEMVGGTAVLKGSHLVPYDEGKQMPSQQTTMKRGDCLLMDYRVFHFGLANRSEMTRPVLSMVYQRPWFADAQNFASQPPLQMHREDFDHVPDGFKGLFSRAYFLD